MRHWQLVSPQTNEEWQRYYQLRFDVLRAPWQQPVGSERDELEAQAFHLMLLNEQGQVAAVGRLHQLDAGTAQVRYMAVAEAFRGKGAGSRILAGLEAQAADWGCSCVKLNARDSALAFYQGSGYRIVEEAPTQFGIRHLVMHKQVRLSATAGQYQHWCQQLSQTWQQTIPLSQYMQLDITSFDGNALCCEAPLAPNINLHQTMFAGSIYALAALTGWGMLYLQLQACGLTGDQVLADASIKYLRPVAKQPMARCNMQNCVGDLSGLAQAKKVRQRIKVDIYSADQLAAQFTGQYAVLPAKVDIG